MKFFSHSQEVIFGHHERTYKTLFLSIMVGIALILATYFLVKSLSASLLAFALSFFISSLLVRFYSNVAYVLFDGIDIEYSPHSKSGERIISWASVTRVEYVEREHQSRLAKLLFSSFSFIRGELTLTYLDHDTERFVVFAAPLTHVNHPLVWGSATLPLNFREFSFLMEMVSQKTMHLGYRYVPNSNPLILPLLPAWIKA